MSGRAHRQSRKRQNRAAQQARQRRRQVLVIGGVAALALIVGAVALASPAVNDGAPGVAVPNQGQEHINPNQPHPAYNSDPPTSGWHYPTDLDAGFYEEPYPDELLVHNLEHGHVVISYDCNGLEDCDGVKDQLRSIFDRYDGWKVTVVPRENADAAIALTAWGRIDKLDGFDEDRITAFIDAWRDRGPEATME